jgi:gas vesicle protein
MDSKRMIGGLLAAVAVGAAIGILLAPNSGKRTRTKLMKGSVRLGDSLEETVEDSLELLRDKFNSGVDEVFKKGKEMMNHANDKIKA